MVDSQHPHTGHTLGAYSPDTAPTDAGSTFRDPAPVPEPNPAAANQTAASTATSKEDPALPSDSSTDTPVEQEQDGEKAPVSAKGPPKDEPSDFEKKSVGKRAVVMLALCMAVFLAALDVTIITTAIPTITEQFNSPSGYTWIGAAFLLANAASVPTWGKVSEIFGRKPVLLCANVVFLVGSLVCALAKNIGMLLAGRTVQGLGAGGLVILVNITIADLFSLRNRGAYYGIIGGVWALSSAIGPIIGGAFTESVSWRWCFYINLPLDGIAFFIILFFLDLKTPKTPLWEGLKAIDWLGSLTVVGGTLMFLFGLEYGGSTYPWKSATVICLILFGIITWAIFFIIEWKVAKYPVIPIQIFKKFSVCATYLIVSIHGMVFIASSYYLPLYFQAALGKTPIISGVLLLPNCVALSFGSLGVGILVRKTGRYLEAIYFGFFMMTLGYGLFIDLDANSSIAKIIIFQLIAGFGIGPLFQAPLIALQSQIKPRDMAAATSTFGFIRQLSTSISVVIGNVIYQNRMNTKTSMLASSIGEKNAQALTGSGAGSNTKLIDSLPEPGKHIVQTAFADSLSKMWILYVCLAFIGLCLVPLVGKRVLSKQHEEAKTGLEAEKEKAAERKKEHDEKAAKKRLSRGADKLHGNDGDLEQGTAATNGNPAADEGEKATAH